MCTLVTPLISAPPCLACGACCFSRLETYVRVSGDDHARLALRAEELAHFIGNRAYMRMTDGHCIALRLDVDTREFVCSAYEMRPDVCRELERESGACAGEIATKQERPPQALSQLRAKILRS